MSNFKTGQTTFVREFGDGPYILIRQGAPMVVRSYQPDPLSSSKTAWMKTSYEIEDNWIVRTKKGNYLQIPTAALSKERPLRFEGFGSSLLLILSVGALAAGPLLYFFGA